MPACTGVGLVPHADAPRNKQPLTRLNDLTSLHSPLALWPCCGTLPGSSNTVTRKRHRSWCVTCTRGAVRIRRAAVPAAGSTLDRPFLATCWALGSWSFHSPVNTWRDQAACLLLMHQGRPTKPCCLHLRKLHLEAGDGEERGAPLPGAVQQRGVARAAGHTRHVRSAHALVAAGGRRQAGKACNQARTAHATPAKLRGSLCCSRSVRPLAWAYRRRPTQPGRQGVRRRAMPLKV